MNQSNNTNDSSDALEDIFMPDETFDMVFYISCYCVGAFVFLGTLFVLIILGRINLETQDITQIFVKSQTLFDCLTGLFLVICTLPVHFKSNSEVVCKFFASQFLLWTCLIGSTYNMILITSERYIMVIHPIWHKSNFTKNLAHICIVAVFMLGLIFGLVKIPTSSVRHGRCMIMHFWIEDYLRDYYVMALIITMQFLPEIYICVAYSKMFVTLRKRREVVATYSTTANEVLSKAQFNVLATMAIASLCLVLCYLPATILTIYAMANKVPKFLIFPLKLSNVLMFVNCGLNPIVYTLKYEWFKREIVKVFKRANNENDNNGIELH